MLMLLILGVLFFIVVAFFGVRVAILISLLSIWWSIDYFQTKKENMFNTYYLDCQEDGYYDIPLSILYNEKFSYACFNYDDYKHIATACKPVKFSIRETYEGFYVGELFSNKKDPLKIHPRSISNNGGSKKCQLKKGSKAHSLPRIVSKVLKQELDPNH